MEGEIESGFYLPRIEGKKKENESKLSYCEF